MDTNNKKSILIIGAATLDRLLYVQEFPNADSKSSCKTQEGGGGNAANTATALGRLLRVRVTSDHHDNDNHDNEHDNDDIEQDDSDTSSTPTKQTCRVKVKLLTKISWDEIGNSLVKELHHDGIDLSSPLFLRSRGSSPVVTVIVTTMPPYTRTCLFDPGTVGTLMPNDLIIIRGGKKNDGNGIGLGNDHDNDNDHENGNDNDNDNDNDNEKARVVSDIMRQCIHLHSDTRHTEVALILAREASKQGVPMSVDVERDRRTREFDELVDLAGTVFTNEDLMKSIVLRRLGYDLFGVDVGGFGTVVGTHDGHGSATECNKLVESDDNDHAHGCFYCNVVKLCYFLTKRPAALVESNHHSQEECIDKELIVTRGELGAVHCKLLASHDYNEDSPTCSASASYDQQSANIHNLALHAHVAPGNTDKFSMTCDNESVIRISQKIYIGIKLVRENDYILHAVGTLKHIHIVDTTGAGDAFIGGYTYSSIPQTITDGLQGLDASSRILFQLRYASWVAGRKIGGIGAREMLPTAEESDDILGIRIDDMDRSLQALISKPNEIRKLYYSTHHRNDHDNGTNAN